MADKEDKIPLDARLLSDAIIELNISRRNVSIYPRDHPSVDKSLNKAFEHHLRYDGKWYPKLRLDGKKAAHLQSDCRYF